MSGQIRSGKARLGYHVETFLPTTYFIINDRFNLVRYTFWVCSITTLPTDFCSQIYLQIILNQHKLEISRPSLFQLLSELWLLLLSENLKLNSSNFLIGKNKSVESFLSMVKLNSDVSNFSTKPTILRSKRRTF